MSSCHRNRSKPIEERSESCEGGLENDALTKGLRAGSEIGPVVDIIALTVPSIRCFLAQYFPFDIFIID